MMNKLQFHRFCSEHEGKFDRGYRVVEGAVRMNSNESEKHFLQKAQLVYHLKYGARPFLESELKGSLFKSLITTWNYPKWYSPRVYTEVRIGKNVFDIVALTLDGAYVIEVADSESEASLKRKERNAINLGFEFETFHV